MSGARLARLLLLSFWGLATSSLAVPLPPGGDPPGELVGPDCEVGFLSDFPADDAFGRSDVHLASPAESSTDVPRNAQIVLGGFLGELDFEPPFLVVKLLGPGDVEVPTTRSGALLRPQGLLAPQTVYRVALRLADPRTCEGCGLERDFQFTTGSDVDAARPGPLPAPRAQALVLSALQRQCAITGRFDATHLVMLRIEGVPTDVARLSVAVRVGDGATVRTADFVRQGAVHHRLHAGVGPIALGDDVVVAVTPIDVAGNTGPPAIVRARARPFADLTQAPFEDLEPRQCQIPRPVTAALPSEVPTNARFVVEMPVESVPVALFGSEAPLPLHPAAHLGASQVVGSSSPLPAGAQLALGALPCPQCACTGCDLSGETPFRVASGPDEEPPSPPRVRALREELAPERAEGECVPDRAALVVVLERGADDQAAAEHLRYDATLHLPGRLPVEVGRALPSFAGADGTFAVRLDTLPYGRLLTGSFELELTAMDLAGNRSTTRIAHEATAGGCSTSGAMTSEPPWALACLLLALWGVAARRKRGVR